MVSGGPAICPSTSQTGRRRLQCVRSVHAPRSGCRRQATPLGATRNQYTGHVRQGRTSATAPTKLAEIERETDVTRTACPTQRVPFWERARYGTRRVAGLHEREARGSIKRSSSRLHATFVLPETMPRRRANVPPRRTTPALRPHIAPFDLNVGEKRHRRREALRTTIIPKLNRVASSPLRL